MAKKRSITIGSVVKGKNGKGDYIKISRDVTLKEGTYLNLESKADQQKRLTESIENGKLSGDFAQKLQDRVNKIPDFVRFEIVKLEDVSE